MTDHLIKPYGGKLSSLIANEAREETLKEDSLRFKSLDLTLSQLCDLELLLSGAYSPLKGFLGEEDYKTVLSEHRLADGTFWPTPVTLQVSETFATTLTSGDRLALRDPEGFMIAVMTVESAWRTGGGESKEMTAGATSLEQVGAIHLFRSGGDFCIGGPVEGIQLPRHHDFTGLRHTPAGLRNIFAERGWRRIVACQTKKAIHRAFHEMTLSVARQHDANLLIQGVATLSDHGGLDHFEWVRCCRAAVAHYPPGMAALNLLPLVVRQESPEETLLQMLVNRNFGCSHFLMDEKTASAADDLLRRFGPETGIEPVRERPFVYVETKGEYLPADEASKEGASATLSNEKLFSLLESGKEMPAWFTFPEVEEELKKSRLPRSRQGFTLFFTGLSGSGKSSTANIVRSKLLERGGRKVTLLDGDLVRKNLSSELNFSREHRDINIMRIGFVANEITKNGGIAVCCPIAPYAGIREYNRRRISRSGGYIEIYVSTPIEECERRDTKGLYAKARAGLIKGMTGIDDPYEVPATPEITLNTMEMTPEEAANEVLLYLQREGYLA